MVSRGGAGMPPRNGIFHIFAIRCICGIYAVRRICDIYAVQRICDIYNTCPLRRSQGTPWSRPPNPGAVSPALFAPFGRHSMKTGTPPKSTHEVPNLFLHRNSLCIVYIVYTLYGVFAIHTACCIYGVACMKNASPGGGSEVYCVVPL